MNLLFATNEGYLTGSTYSISFLADGLAKRGHNVFLSCRDGSMFYELLKDSPVKLIATPYKSKVDLKSMKIMRDVVQKEKIQIINAQSSKDRYLTIFAKWLYKLDVKIVHTRRQKPESVGGWLQNNFYIRNTEKIVMISDELKNTFVKRGFPQNHLHVIYNGTPSSQYKNIDLEKIKAFRKQFGLEEEDIVIGCVSRMKRQDQLIKALPFLDPNIKVIFAGITPGTLDELAKEYGVKNKIIYAGHMSHEDVLHLYRLMNINVLPSTTDGFGLVLVEAMAMGTPVVATRAAGIINVVDDGINGLLFENENIEELAKKLKKLLTDGGLRENLIKNGKVTALEKFSIEKTVLNYEAFFSSLIKN